MSVSFEISSENSNWPGIVDKIIGLSSRIIIRRK